MSLGVDVLLTWWVDSMLGFEELAVGPCCDWDREELAVGPCCTWDRDGFG